MKKYVLGLFTAVVVLLLSLNAYAIDIGFGLEQDDGDLELDLSLDWNKENGLWQSNIEFDFVTEESDGEEEENLTYFNFKQNYQLNDKTYILGLVQIDNDKYRSNYKTRSIIGAGFGYKVYRSEKLKISNEYSVAYLESDSSEAIYRNSMWVSYKLADKFSATNKLLYESGNNSYTRNEFEINYDLADNITVGISWRHIDEGFQDRDTKSINFGIKF
jgi:putative salt-induced outer membrane protein YdiY